MKKGTSINKLLVMAVSALIPALVHAQTPLILPLWSFETGAQGWWANPFGGGKVTIAAVPGKFGQGLGATWEDVKGGGNIVSPFINDRPELGRAPWTTISFWLKGDGTQAHTTLAILCAGPGDKEIGYSREVPLDSTIWRRFSFDMTSFWNREELPFDPSKIRRLTFCCYGTQKLAVDDIALQQRQRPVPLDCVDARPGFPVTPELFAFEDAWLLRLDPSGLPEGTQAATSVTWPGAATAATARAPFSPKSEAQVWLSPPPDRKTGKAQLNLTIGAAMAAYEFPVAHSLPPLKPQLGLLPTPKQVVLKPGEKSFRPANRLSIVAGGPRAVSVGDYLGQQLRSRCGIEAPVARTDRGECAYLIVSAGASLPPPPPPPAPSADGPEAYHLTVFSTGALIEATTRAGLRYGAYTLLQLIESARPSGEIPAMDITDWPSLPVRGITIPLPTDRWGHPNDAPVDPAFYEDFLLRTCIEHKLNTVVLLVHQGMQYKRHPEIGGPAAWPQETVRHLVETLKANDINVIPQLNSLGHANWLVIPIARLREDGDTDTLCTRHPDSKSILLDCYEEVLDVFRPTYFHMGFDEIRWQTLDKPEADRCKLCAGVDKREIFVAQVKMLRDFLVSRGVKPMMWGDMVLRSHNGGPPFQLADTLTRLPRDITICNWSVTLDLLSHHLFRSLGFPVIQANSLGVNPAEAAEVGGNLFGVWAKHPWLTEGAGGPSTSFSYLSILEAAEYSWNLQPDALAADAPLDDAFFRDRMAALTRLGQSAPIGPTTPLTATGEITAAETCRAGRIGFALWDKPAEPQPGADVSVPVNCRAKSLYFLVAAKVEEKARADFYREFQKRDSWRGVPIGEFVIQYGDGTSRSRLLYYGVDIRDAVSVPLPYAHNAIGYWTAPDGRTWYALQWTNPEPGKAVARVVVRLGTTAARPLLAAMASEPIRSSAT